MRRLPVLLSMFLVAGLSVAACGGDTSTTGGTSDVAGGSADVTGSDVEDGHDAVSNLDDDSTSGSDGASANEPASDATTRGGGGPSDEPWQQPVADGDWQWLSHHGGESAGYHDYTEPPDAIVEYSRFEIFQPFEIRAIKVQVEIFQAGPLTVHLYDDWGGNFLHPEITAPLASVTQDVNPSDSGKWLTFAIDPPLTVDPGRLVYPGIMVADATAPRLHQDGAQDEVEGKPVKSLLWQSTTVDPEIGTLTVFGGAIGDYMIELDVRHLDVVQGDTLMFEPIDLAATGLPGISRGAFADYDDDGDLDLMSGARLYQNDGAGSFTDVTADVLPEGVTANGGVWGDYDNDGDEDYLGSGEVDILLRNDDGIFVDVTAESGIDDTQEHTCNGVTATKNVPTESVTWIDVDRDGWLDAYIGGFICWDDGIPAKDTVFRNNGDGTFSNANTEFWVAFGQGYGQATRGMAPADFDGDGFTDLMVTNYRLHQNLFWHNQGDGTLKEAAQDIGVDGVLEENTNITAWGHSIGATWLDFDHDQDLDLFVANLAHPRFFDFSDRAMLYTNAPGPDGTAVMYDTTPSNIRYQETASDPISWDFDNDGDEDLLWTCIYEHRPSQFYRNEFPSNAWTEVSYPTGINITNGWGVIAGDIDDDGDLDLVSRTSWLNRNMAGHASLQIRPRGLGAGFTNRSGFGARVSVTVDGTPRLQEAVTSRGTTSQSSPWLHFGLGTAAAADFTVEFPASGRTFTFEDVAAGRYTVDEDGNLEHQR